MHYNLQGLKLQGTNIRNGVVLSQYSGNKWFANDLSIFFMFVQTVLLLSHRVLQLKLDTNPQVGGSCPSCGALYTTSVLFSGK